MLKDLDIDSLEILNCHNLARKKYEKLGLSFIDCTPNAEKLSFFLQMLTEESLNYSFLKI